MNSSLTGLLGGSRDRGRLSPAGGSGELGSGGCSYHKWSRKVFTRGEEMGTDQSTQRKDPLQGNEN